MGPIHLACKVDTSAVLMKQNTNLHTSATKRLTSQWRFRFHNEASEERMVKFSRLYTSNMFQPRLRPSVT